VNDAFDFTGETIVLTGGAGILGARFADAFARRGASIAVLDRDVARARNVAAEVVRAHGVRAIAIETDVADRAAVTDARRRVEQSLGRASVLVDPAATKTEGFFDPFEAFRPEDWDEVMRTNVTGAMFAAQEFGAEMARHGGGSIVNILSIYGVVAPDQRIYEGSMYEGRPINTPAVYSVSKAALWGLTQYLAAYWGQAGVRVNAVSPGGVFSGQNETFVQRYSARVPFGRMAEVDEISGAVVFLASRAASYVTGQNIVVDGGLSAW
jgi:NAD(P)-dependent dehydrogenase (short-subunit alcohol dehydrogenase family)